MNLGNVYIQDYMGKKGQILAQRNHSSGAGHFRSAAAFSPPTLPEGPQLE